LRRYQAQSAFLTPDQIAQQNALALTPAQQADQKAKREQAETDLNPVLS
jgi:hypothetical protein